MQYYFLLNGGKVCSVNIYKHPIPSVLGYEVSVQFLLSVTVVKNPPALQDSIPGLGRSSAGGHGNSL